MQFRLFFRLPHMGALAVGFLAVALFLSSHEAWSKERAKAPVGQSSASAKAGVKAGAKSASSAKAGAKAGGRAVSTKNASKKVQAKQRSRTAKKGALARGAAPVRRAAARSAPAAALSFGQKAGLHEDKDPLALASGVALVVDQETSEVLFSKNSQAVLPIASITKLMTGLLITESGLSLDEKITITQDDVDTEKGSQSRLRVGTELTRGEMLHLALMSSENRAANALGRTYPGGLNAFVEAMNAKAVALGMHDTLYVEPTGLSSKNQSSAADLATLVKEAYNYPLLRELSTSPQYEVSVGRKRLEYTNTNSLVKNPGWEIGLQKTGYIVEAGRCLVMQARLAGRKLIMVFLDSAGKYSRIADAERVRKWLTTTSSGFGAPAVKAETETAF
jgi:D-alanyl-D-alanine endopeptidase (penicillin-binding protein 7)